MTESEFDTERIGPWVRVENEYNFEKEVWLNEESDQYLIVEKIREQWFDEPQYQMTISEERMGTEPEIKMEAESKGAILDLARDKMEEDVDA